LLIRQARHVLLIGCDLKISAKCQTRHDEGKTTFRTGENASAGKGSAPYVTRSEKRKARKDKKLWEFLLAYSKPSRAQREHYEFLTGRKAQKPLTKKEREAWVRAGLYIENCHHTRQQSQQSRLELGLRLSH
jgi:hypothetical protein